MKLTIVGGGPSCIYVLYHLRNHIKDSPITEICIIDSQEAGIGFPYHPINCNPEHLANIQFSDVPLLPAVVSYPENIKKEHKFPSRIELGKYLRKCFLHFVNILQKEISHLELKENTVVTDITFNNQKWHIIYNDEKHMKTDILINATGHGIIKSNDQSLKYIDCPWPIDTIFKNHKQPYNFTIGILGASLGSYDILYSLALIHGNFCEDDNKIIYQRNENASEFKVVLHSIENWLPQLEYEENFIDKFEFLKNYEVLILEHVQRNGLMTFDELFRLYMKDMLLKAYRMEGNKLMVLKCSNNEYSFSDFIKDITEQNNTEDPFGRLEQSIKNFDNRNQYYGSWKVVFDSFMMLYNELTASFTYASYEFFRKKVQPILMNVISSIPLISAKRLIALHKAKAVEFIQCNILEIQDLETNVLVKINNGNDLKYKMFIDCNSNEDIEFENYPYKSLVNYEIVEKGVIENQIVCGVNIQCDTNQVSSQIHEYKNFYELGFNHTKGLKPYCYGLDYCNYAAYKVVVGIIKDFNLDQTKVN